MERSCWFWMCPSVGVFIRLKRGEHLKLSKRSKRNPEGMAKFIIAV